MSAWGWMGGQSGLGSDSLPGYLQSERWSEKLFWQKIGKFAAELLRANDVIVSHGPEQGRRKAELDGAVPGPVQGCKQTLVATHYRQTAF